MLVDAIRCYEVLEARSREVRLWGVARADWERCLRCSRATLNRYLKEIRDDGGVIELDRRGTRYLVSSWGAGWLSLAEQIQGRAVNAKHCATGWYAGGFRRE